MKVSWTKVALFGACFHAFNNSAVPLKRSTRARSNVGCTSCDEPEDVASMTLRYFQTDACLSLMRRLSMDVRGPHRNREASMISRSACSRIYAFELAASVMWLTRLLTLSMRPGSSPEIRLGQHGRSSSMAVLMAATRAAETRSDSSPALNALAENICRSSSWQKGRDSGLAHWTIVTICCSTSILEMPDKVLVKYPSCHSPKHLEKTLT
jgi:hypothetical protein